MKLTKALIVPVLVAAPVLLNAQQVTISGYVSEKKSGEKLIGAAVFLPGKNIGTTTNAFGFYSLTIPAGKIGLRASYIGFAQFADSLQADKNLSLNIALEQSKDIKEVVVTSQKDAIQNRTQMSSIDLPIATIKSLPAFLGEVDVLKVIQLLPGVQAGGEGTSGLYVRGGGPDQNLILLDGVPVYNASHLFGFFSVFNADAIRNVEVMKGGFPARYGGRISSVIDINMKEGDQQQIHGEGGIGLIASRLTLEGPIQKGKSSFMISGRRTYIDVLTKPFMKDEFKAGYYFYDLNGKVNFKLGKKDHIYFSGYFGNDKFDSRSKSTGMNSTAVDDAGLRWGNATAVGRWNHEFSPKLFGNLTAYYSQYQFNISAQSQSTFSGGQDAYLMRYASGINDKTLKYDFDYLPNPNHYIKTGVSYIDHTYNTGVQSTKVTSSSSPNLDTTIGTQPLQAAEIDAYIEDDIKISSKLKANVGIHWTGFSVRDKFYHSLQPRVSARYLVNDQLSVKASYVQMSQFIHLLTNSSIGLPTDLWVPVTDRVPQQRSHQAAAGVAYTHESGIELSLEGYYKTMDNVIEYKEGASFFNSSNSWEDKVEIGKGKSYGAEVFLQKKKGRLTGMAGYTLSWTNRQFDNLNEGKVFPYRYDRRHDIKIAGVYKVAKNIEVSAEWVFGTGNAITMPVGMYQGPDGMNVQVYGSRNGYRMQPYHRADAGIKFLKEHKRNWESAWVIGVYNLYGRKNPFYIYSTTDGSGATTFKQISLFSIIPSITYQFKF